MILLLLLVSINTKGQEKIDSLICKNLEIASLKASVNSLGFSYGKMLYISKDSLRNGFTIVLSDTSYRIIGFVLYYDSAAFDIWLQDIYGNKTRPENVLILNNLKKGEKLEINCLNLEFKGKRYTASGFTIAITD